MRTLLFISVLIFTLPFFSKGNVDCIYSASKSGITVRYTSPCFSEKYQTFVDSFLYQLVHKINRVDSTSKILVLINMDHIYYGFSGSPNYFTSIGFDTLRELNSHFITSYGFSRYSNSEQSRLRPLDINATDKLNANSEMGIKIIYNVDYRNDINWTEIEKLVNFASSNFQRIKNTQERDTVRHYSWYVTLVTLDSFQINHIVGRTNNFDEEVIKVERRNDGKGYWVWVTIGLLMLGFIIYRFKSHSR